MATPLRGMAFRDRHELEAFPVRRLADLHPGNIFVARQVAVLCGHCRRPCRLRLRACATLCNAMHMCFIHASAPALGPAPH